MAALALRYRHKSDQHPSFPINCQQAMRWAIAQHDTCCTFASPCCGMLFPGREAASMSICELVKEAQKVTLASLLALSAPAKGLTACSTTRYHVTHAGGSSSSSIPAGC